MSQTYIPRIGESDSVIVSQTHRFSKYESDSQTFVKVSPNQQWWVRFSTTESVLVSKKDMFLDQIYVLIVYKSWTYTVASSTAVTGSVLCRNSKFCCKNSVQVWIINLVLHVIHHYKTSKTSLKAQKISISLTIWYNLTVKSTTAISHNCNVSLSFWR